MSYNKRRMEIETLYRNIAKDLAGIWNKFDPDLGFEVKDDADVASADFTDIWIHDERITVYNALFMIENKVPYKAYQYWIELVELEGYDHRFNYFYWEVWLKSIDKVETKK